MTTPKRSTFGAAGGKVFSFDLRARSVKRIKGKVAGIQGRTTNGPLPDVGQASQLKELVISKLKEPASSGETIRSSSDDHSSDSKPGQVGPNVEGEADGFKRCTTCGHSKLLVDFQTTTTSADGRYEVCRACKAAYCAKRAGHKESHLYLSVAESWERAKKCFRCGRIKEARDFGVDRRNEDLLNKCCRGCISMSNAAIPDRQPQDEPQECRQCVMVKPATEFHLQKKNLTGRRMQCNQCRSDETIRKYDWRRREHADGAFVHRSKKRCSICGEEKVVEQFYRNRLSADGHLNACKPCLSANRQRRAAATALAQVEVPDGARVGS